MATTVSDPQRQLQSKQALALDRDKLLQRGSQTNFVPQNDGKDFPRAVLTTLLFVSVCAGFYFVMMWAWFSVYHQSFFKFILVFFILALAGGGATLASYKRILGKDRETMRFCGLLAIQATIIALVVGFFIYFGTLVFYFKYKEMRTYTNVGAAQTAGAFRDGSMFLFTEDTRLDPLRAAGYQSRWNGKTYCVAPIVDQTMTTASAISFWAVGENCCSTRANFHCDSGEDFNTRTGLAVLKAEDIVRPYMRWAVKGDAYKFYMEAIQMQEATYATQAASKPVLVRWINDPIKLKDSFYDSAMQSLWDVTLVYFGMLTVACFTASWRFLPKRLPPAGSVIR